VEKETLLCFEMRIQQCSIFVDPSNSIPSPLEEAQLLRNNCKCLKVKISPITPDFSGTLIDAGRYRKSPSFELPPLSTDHRDLRRRPSLEHRDHFPDFFSAHPSPTGRVMMSSGNFDDCPMESAFNHHVYHQREFSHHHLV
jgi:hypothetical protein